MSIFDTPKATLNPVLWTPENMLRPEARQHFLELLDKTYPRDKVSAFVMLGSSVGYQYSNTSDIDINMMAIVGEEAEYWHPIFKRYNNTPNLYPGTQHPINLFFQEYFGQANWNNSLGSYDVINNVWIKKGMSVERLGDPYKKFEREIAYGKLLLSMIESEVNCIKRATAEGDKQDVERRVKGLAKIFHNVAANRKLSYSHQIGTPALQENNILYKLIEASPYAELFHELTEKFDDTVF